MIEAILIRLTGDVILAELLGATAADSRIYPLSSNNFGPCIIYTDTPQDGGLIRRNNLELRIIGRDYIKVREIERRLNVLLDFKEGGSGDKGWTYNDINIMSSMLVGGGDLEMSDVYQRFPVYRIIWRYLPNG